MTRYVTTEERYDCPKCDTRFALRETAQVGTNPDKPLHECPCCKDSFVMFDTLKTVEGPQEVEVWGLQSLWDKLPALREVND
jgi:transcription initiation factor IIE alpha subunit